MRSKEQRKFISFCEENGGPLIKRGKRKHAFKCLCPFHIEKNGKLYFLQIVFALPLFRVWVLRQGF